MQINNPEEAIIVAIAAGILLLLAGIYYVSEQLLGLMHWF